MNSEHSPKLAVLIDADNAPADIINRLLEEIAKYGTATVKRIYGDWSSGLSKWKAALLPHAIIPVQQFAYTRGKNATDMALVIDAMDLLYSGNFDGFCIVSSDSDFTRLASRLRESGHTVYGFGEKKTPEAFRKACDKFIYTEIFRPEKAQRGNSKNSNKNRQANDDEATKSPLDAGKDEVFALLKRAVKENADDLGWASLGPIGSYINKTHPDFDPRLYGFGKLSDLIKSFDQFEYRTDNNQIQVRRKSMSEAPSKSPVKRASSARSSKQLAAASVASSEPAISVNPKAQFSKIIPLVQKAIEDIANTEGWATLSNITRQIQQIEPDFRPEEHGFDSMRSLLHAIYSDWLTIQKAGRGERVKINKRFKKTNENHD